MRNQDGLYAPGGDLIAQSGEASGPRNKPEHHFVGQRGNEAVTLESESGGCASFRRGKWRDDREASILDRSALTCREACNADAAREGHHDERCFLPIHVYDTAAGRPVAIILRSGKTPSRLSHHGGDSAGLVGL